MESLGTEARMKRPERAEAHSPGQHPGLLRTQTCRPVRAKAFTPETSKNRIGPVLVHFFQKVQKRFKKSKNRRRLKKMLSPKSINKCKKSKRSPALVH